jgi:AcrR family transcriptional regulator
MATRKSSASARKKPKQARSAAMVEGILEAAARVFIKQGFAKATTNRIAEAAGISVGSLYQYFPSKDAIAVELLRRYRERVVNTIARRVQEAKPETFADFVRTLLKDMLNDASIDPTLQRVLIEQVLRTSARREMLGFEEQLEATIANTLRATMPEPEVAAFVLVRAVLSVVQAAVADRPKLNTPVLVDELTRLVVGYVGVVAQPTSV